jgi:hypothetical protein
MIYACPTCEYAANAHLLKLQLLQNRVLRAIGYLDRRTLLREMHVASKIPWVYGYITKLCRMQAKVTLNRPIVLRIGQGEATRRKYERLKFGCGQAYDHSAD